MEIVNSFADSQRFRRIEWDELLRCWPQTKDDMPTEGRKQVTASVHYECTIALHMLQTFQGIDETYRPKSVEIGISKHCCWLCEKYLDLLSRWVSLRFIVAGYQGKIHSGWKPPSNGPADVLEGMTKIIRKEMNEILKGMLGRHQSDSCVIEQNLGSSSEGESPEAWDVASLMDWIG